MTGRTRPAAVPSLLITTQPPTIALLTVTFLRRQSATTTPVYATAHHLGTVERGYQRVAAM